MHKMVPLLDLLVFKLGGRLGAEIKWTDALPLTGSMRIALANLQLAHLSIVYPASNLYEFAREVMDYPDHPASNQVGPGMPLTEIDPLLTFTNARFRLLRILNKSATIAEGCGFPDLCGLTWCARGQSGKHAT